MIRVRQAEASDIAGMLRLQQESYPTLASVSAWREDHILQHIEVFPEGQLVAADAHRVVGMSSSFITRHETAFAPHTFREITHRGTFAGHVPDGDTLYGAEIMVHPDLRRRGIASRLYVARFKLVRERNLRYFAAGGRVPGYDEVADRLTIEQYVEEVVAGVRQDRVLTPQLRNGMLVRGVLKDYLNDPKSRNNASLLVWVNPEWEEEALAERGELPPMWKQSPKSR